MICDVVLLASIYLLCVSFQEGSVKTLALDGSARECSDEIVRMLYSCFKVTPGPSS